MITKKLSFGHLSGIQFGTFVTAGYMALGIFYFPRQLVAAAGRDGIWALWIDGLVTFLLMKLSFKMSKLVPSQTFVQFSGDLASKPLGIFLALIRIVYHFVLAVIITVLFTSFMGNDFLPGTPSWALSGILIVGAVYMAWFGTTALARTLEVGYIPMVALTTLTLALAMSVVKYPLLLAPPVNIQVIPILQAAYHEFFIFIGFEVSMTLYPFVAEKEQKRAEFFAIGGLAVMIIILTIMYEACIATFGPSYIPYIRWPIIALLRIIEVSGFFVDKWGSLVVALWTIAVLGFLAVRLWCVVHDIAAIFFVHSVRAYHYLLLPCAVTVYIMAAMIPNAVLTEVFMQKVLLPTALLYQTIVPIFLLAVSIFRPKVLEKLRKRTHTEPQLTS